jgi:hypothetical protein
MEQNEQNNGEDFNPIYLYLFLGTIAVAILGVLYKAFI